jgi:hypothetical protein
VGVRSGDEEAKGPGCVARAVEGEAQEVKVRARIGCLEGAAFGEGWNAFFCEFLGGSWRRDLCTMFWWDFGELLGRRGFWRRSECIFCDISEVAAIQNLCTMFWVQQ